MKIKILLVLLLFLAVLSTVAFFRYHPASSRGSSEGVTERLKLVANGEFNAFTISEGTQQIQFKQYDIDWKANEEWADYNAIEEIKDAFTHMKISGPISKNPNNHKQFGLTEDESIRVAFFKDEEEKLALLIGKNPAASGETYIRFAGENEVYSASFQLQKLFSLDIEKWKFYDDEEGDQGARNP